MRPPINESVAHVLITEGMISEAKAQTGKPITLRLYRGDDGDRDDFSGGTYWTSLKEDAISYGGKLSKVRITLQNPLVTKHINDATDWNFDQQALMEAGHDGIIGYLRDTGRPGNREPGIVVYLFNDVSDEVIKEAESNKPFRNRVEVFAQADDGDVYGGLFPDGTFGAFGGGTDGEAAEEAAQREFEEETGHKVTDLEKIPVKPVECIWKHDAKTDKDKERMAKYKGSRTWFYRGRYKKDDGKKAKGDDGKSPLKKVGWYPVEKAIELIKGNLSDEPDYLAQQKARIKALEAMADTNVPGDD